MFVGDLFPIRRGERLLNAFEDGLDFGPRERAALSREQPCGACLMVDLQREANAFFSPLFGYAVHALQDGLDQGALEKGLTVTARGWSASQPRTLA